MSETRDVVRLHTEIFHTMTYPAGEGHVTIKNGPPASYHTDTLAVIWEARTYNDLCTILLARETYRRVYGEMPFKIVVPYFPYARHDRRNGPGDSNPAQFAINLMRPMIDEGSLIIIDPHSDVTGVIPHISQADVVREAAQFLVRDTTAFLIPDQGATKKTHLWLTNMGLPSIQGLKHRDPMTGKLSGFGIAEEDKALVDGRDLLIVDDICDGGGTFLGLVSAIDGNYRGVDLLVTHGLFTKGIDDITDAFDTVTTLDIYARPGDAENLLCIDTKKLIRDAILNNRIQ